MVFPGVLHFQVDTLKLCVYTWEIIAKTWGDYDRLKAKSDLSSSIFQEVGVSKLDHRAIPNHDLSSLIFDKDWSVYFFLNRYISSSIFHKIGMLKFQFLIRDLSSVIFDIK